MFKFLLNKESLFLACSQLCFGVLGALIVQVGFHRPPSLIATVNISELEDSFIKATVKQDLSPIVMKQKAALFSKGLNEVIIQIAKEKHVILIPSQAIIAGSVPDLTEEIANRVKRGLT